LVDWLELSTSKEALLDESMYKEWKCSTKL
jgi:hypothetical protein